jgi:signal transduction histidine kinase/CheY-like chemotaxis protein
MELSETREQQNHRSSAHSQNTYQVGAVPLSTVLITESLATRPSRDPEYQAENEALVSLAETLANHSADILHKLAEQAQRLCRADSAGISIAEVDKGEPLFRWHAISGRLATFVNGTMPRFFSPCGEVVDRQTPQLMQNPVRHYPYISSLGVDLCEALLVPFHRGTEVIGTVWVIAHDSGKHFDREDLRCLQSLCKFASTAVVALQNIQALKETSRRLQDANARLAEASKRKDEFLATLSHELRSPLNIIQGHAELLRLETPGSEEFAESLDAIERSARLQTQLIADMLDVSRIITGKMLLNIEVFDPRDIVLDAVRAIQFAADAKSIQLLHDIGTEVGTINGDRGRLQQALWNLLANAVKFSAPGGQITIQVHRKNSHIEFTVLDQGQGIDPDFLPYVFNRFHQEDGSKSRKHGGLGLGLAIVRHIAELHGGSVQVSSPGKDKGATFILAIPVVAVVDDLHEPHAETGRVNPSTTAGAIRHLAHLKILVVDDQAEAAALLKRSLELLGASVLIASSAESAWLQLELMEFHLLISDIGMPGINGFDLIKTWRSKERMLGRRPMPALALTAYGTPEDRAEILAAGYTAHLAKPAGLRELTDAILQEVGPSSGPLTQ